MKPNIVFFLIDGLRADVCFDENKTCCTPNLDSLKKNSVSFTQAYSSADGTFTSLNSLFSGHFPFRTGVRAQRILLKKNNFPVFCKDVFPVDAYGRWQIVEFNKPIFINGQNGDVQINPGDIIFADNDSVISINSNIAKEVLALSLKRLKKENLIFIG